MVKTDFQNRKWSLFKYFVELFLAVMKHVKPIEEVRENDKSSPHAYGLQILSRS